MIPRHRVLSGCSILALVLAGCGGGAGGGQSVDDFIAGLPQKQSTVGDITVAAPAPNVVPITVGSGNKLLVSVTVCQPGTAICRVVDKVMLDTGSVGLRLHSSALSGFLDNLASDQVDGSTIGECAVFGNFYTWGTLRTADVRMSGASASGLRLQIYDDSSLPPASTSGCDTLYGGLSDPVPSSFQFNGILGVKGARVDNQRYFVCSGGNCVPHTQDASSQLPNPVPLLSTDNNGFVIQMPPLPNTGVASANGALVFGINTRFNNQLATNSPAPSMIPLDSQLGFQLSVGGNAHEALIDSGTSVLALPGLAIPTCAGSQPARYCPANEIAVPILAKASSEAILVVSAVLQIGNAAAVLGTGNAAFNNVATVIPSALAGFSIGALIGVPFFFGRSIYFSVDGQTTTVGGATWRKAFVAF